MRIAADRHHHRLRPARPADFAYGPYLRQLRRTAPGYEGELAPFNPRNWLEVHPAPAW
ncbi:hypothetical protein AB0J35_54340 [Nonomuraea angiospora]|uniref:hypothetical protein n=1 Tax=Nonomuraea angiospora TaxID=46172 RepID=UPI00341D7680